MPSRLARLILPRRRPSTPCVVHQPPAPPINPPRRPQMGTRVLLCQKNPLAPMSTGAKRTTDDMDAGGGRACTCLCVGNHTSPPASQPCTQPDPSSSTRTHARSLQATTRLRRGPPRCGTCGTPRSRRCCGCRRRPPEPATRTRSARWCACPLLASAACLAYVMCLAYAASLASAACLASAVCLASAACLAGAPGDALLRGQLPPFPSPACLGRHPQRAVSRRLLLLWPVLRAALLGRL
jgi:hypothetical protein